MCKNGLFNYSFGIQMITKDIIRVISFLLVVFIHCAPIQKEKERKKKKIDYDTVKCIARICENIVVN